MGRSHVSLKYKLSMKGSQRKKKFNMGGRTKKFEMPCPRQMQKNLKKETLCSEFQVLIPTRACAMPWAILLHKILASQDWLQK